MHDLQIAVAKAMGWKITPRLRGQLTMYDIYRPDGTWSISDEYVRSDVLPLLTLDLMWEAEEMLSGSECLKYADEINLQTKSMRHITLFSSIHATAEQRAKAWLKVKGVEL